MTSKFATLLRRVAIGAAPLMLIWGLAAEPARAQDATVPVQAQTQQNLPGGKIEQLVAPIALYPDPLLTQVLMASTYPLEVVEAARWSQANPAMTGTSLQDAMQSQTWDPSVKALTAVPQTLQMMSAKLDWTEQLGDAFLAQQQDVLAAVQKLRAQAQAAGNLQSTPQQVVTIPAAPVGLAGASVQQPIVIEPVNPDVYYVPIYNPAVVFGAWGYPDYQPFYWYPPGFVASNAVSFAAGVAVGAAIWGNCDWWNHNVIINVNRFNAFNHTNINVADNHWAHNPAHRGNVPYHNAALAQRFGQEHADNLRDEFRDRNAGTLRDDLRDRLNTVHPAASRPMDRADDIPRDLVAPSEHREANIEHDLGSRPERSDAFARPHVDRPRIGEGADPLRWRSIGGFRPTAHAFGGFRRFGGMRRL